MPWAGLKYRLAIGVGSLLAGRPVWSPKTFGLQGHRVLFPLTMHSPTPWAGLKYRLAIGVGSLLAGRPVWSPKTFGLQGLNAGTLRTEPNGYR